MSHPEESQSHDWLTNHAHDPNPEPPSLDPTFQIRLPTGDQYQIDLSILQGLPTITIPDCYIISTGHGTSGPFTFTGIRIDVLIEYCVSQIVPEEQLEEQSGEVWNYADVISADGFGTRLFVRELSADGPMLLAYEMDGVAMSREQGLVRLIVPSEKDDALRQVKWVDEILLYTGDGQ